MWGAWVGGTLIGTIAGSAFDAAAFGADGAIAAGFIALAVDQVAGRKSVITAIVAFATSMILMLWVESGIAVVGATIVAIIVGRAIGVHKELAR
jgi:predicted branched-subunit amino acid permease